MCSFQGIWAWLNPQGEYKRRYQACARLWGGYSPEMQQRIRDSLHAAREQGEAIPPNPYFAIEDTALRLQTPPRRQTLSYAEYYKRYGTTEPRDGWQMANPTGQKVIYIR